MATNMHFPELSDSVERRYPLHPMVSVHPIVLHNDQILLVRRANEPNKGRWSIPGGVVEVGETLKVAADREVLEECCVEIEARYVFDVVDNILADKDGSIRYHYVLIFMLAKLVNGVARPASDAADVLWAGLGDLDGLDMPPLARKVVERAFRLKLGGTPGQVTRTEDPDDVSY